MERINQVIAYAKEKLLAEQTGHDFLHVQRVAHLAEKIVEADDLVVNQEIMLSAAYLHDVIDDKVVPDVARAIQELQVFLSNSGFEKEAIACIFMIIQNLSFSKEMEAGKQALPLEGQIVQDADRIEALGAIGILRTAYYGGGHGHPIHDETLAPQEYKSKSDYRKGSTVINHFYEKLFLLPDRMNTHAGKKEAIRRKEWMTQFLEEFYYEWRI
uniref:HD domain-containing protein n=1 Tax=Candidatus Enterococcus willemsii TaxID=1857215 RepID=UPI00403F1A4F